jgi:nucleolar protein 56
VVSSFQGAFLVEGGRIVEVRTAPSRTEDLAERARLRHEGLLTPEEVDLLRDPSAHEWVTSDRRLAGHGPRYDPDAIRLPPDLRSDRSVVREALLAEGARALDAAWDPSIHVEEAVRASADLDRVKNLVGERLGSWVSRDSPDIDSGDHARAAASALDGGAPTSPLGPGEVSLVAARKRLAELYRSIEATQADLARAVEAATPERTPNLAALLGPDLAARMLAQAGGLDRLARLPSSTVQVLGAERAFFEHLRGRAPPPRHGLLFLHPAIQSAPRHERGKLARALAGKVAIAARMDHESAAVDPNLARAFERRRADLKAQRKGSRRPRPGA